MNIISALGIEGGCNCQFALHPESYEYADRSKSEVANRLPWPRATGYPIAKVAQKYNRIWTDEIPMLLQANLCLF